MWGTALSRLEKRLTLPRRMAKPGLSGDSSDPANRACNPTQIPMNGFPARMYSFNAGTTFLSCSAVIQCPKLPTPQNSTFYESAEDWGWQDSGRFELVG